MYKFTNGLVVFDEKAKERLIKAGYKLIIEKDADKKDFKDLEVEDGENNTSDKLISKIDKRNKKAN